MRIYAELQDADAFFKTVKVAPYQSTWDLRRGYIDLGKPEKNHVAFRVGRQDLSFGWQRLIGTAYWRNASAGYDAAMAIVNWGALRVNAFSASRVNASANGLSHHQPGSVLRGLYGRLRNVLPKADIEPYLFWRVQPGLKTEAGAAAKLDEKTAGLHVAGTLSHIVTEKSLTSSATLAATRSEHGHGAESSATLSGPRR